MGQTPSSLAHSTKANIRTSKVLSTDVDLEMVDDKTSTANPRPAPSSMANGAKASIRKDKSKGHTAKAIAAKGKVSKQGEEGSGQRHTLASAAAGVKVRTHRSAVDDEERPESAVARATERCEQGKDRRRLRDMQPAPHTTDTDTPAHD